MITRVFQEQLTWLEENKIEYDTVHHVQLTVDPRTFKPTFKPVPYMIEIKDEKDQAWYTLRWS